ncbi:hypothetical protein NDU88_007311 [Pleurodeles waltl]|uniref:Uncharacterized protein n=1 Tax=Pleurodeles waltl TaxID=8319 RepID=A0AAV7SRY0_PLEWA|nr:hypothetical protein NDU88_007311 [Pleurodeles waltl]
MSPGPSPLAHCSHGLHSSPPGPTRLQFQFGPPGAAPRRSDHRQPRGQATVPARRIPDYTAAHQTPRRGAPNPGARGGMVPPRQPQHRGPARPDILKAHVRGNLSAHLVSRACIPACSTPGAGRAALLGPQT